MFTGIIELIGEIKDISPGNGNVNYTITNASEILTDCHIGDSIAVDGVCLTVIEFDKTSFTVGVSSETFRRTTMENLKVGSKVNLERAMGSTGNTRFGGHYVQGHVDGVATIVGKKPDDDGSLIFTFQFEEPKYINYVVEKGFICVDGTSLTVTSVNYSKATFSIMMVVHTQENVVVSKKVLGDKVNIEVDVSAKVVEKQISIQLEGQFSNPNSNIFRLVERLVEQKIESRLKKL